MVFEIRRICFDSEYILGGLFADIFKGRKNRMKRQSLNVGADSAGGIEKSEGRLRYS